MKLLSLFFLMLPLSCFALSPLVEVKAGYFFFTDSKLNKIFHNEGEDVQLSVSLPFANFGCWELDVYGSFEFWERTGRSLHGLQNTRFQGYPISIGFKPVLWITSHAQLYSTVGPRYVVTHVHNFSDYVDKHLVRGGFGVFANLGYLYTLSNCLTFDLFGEYSYVPVSYHTRKTNVMAHTIHVGGFTFGGGLGYRF